MDKSRTGLGLIQKSYIISPEEEKNARIFTNTNREQAILIKTINAIGKALKPFFINKGAHVLRNLIEAMIKSGATLATTHNGWSNMSQPTWLYSSLHLWVQTRGVLQSQIRVLNCRNRQAGENSMNQVRYKIE